MTERPFSRRPPEATTRRVLAVFAACVLAAGMMTASLGAVGAGRSNSVSAAAGPVGPAVTAPRPGAGVVPTTVAHPTGTTSPAAAGASTTTSTPGTVGAPVSEPSPSSTALAGEVEAGSAAVVPTCLPGQLCLTADGDQSGVPLGHVASGFLHDTEVANPAVLAAVAPTSWRVAIIPEQSGSLDFSAFDAALRSGAKTIDVVVSDAWFWATNNGCGVPSQSCGAETPWGHLGAYGTWLERYVHQIEATGRRPTYWEVQNEPDALMVPGNYFDAYDANGVTVADELAQFATAYHAIKAADPSAKVLGPSLADYRAAPDGRFLDMGTFLSFSASHGLRWDGLSWHENVTSPQDPQPADVIGGHVATTRRLLAGFPTLGHPIIAITEYGDMNDRILPGWIVGDMAALEDSGVSFADRTCGVALSDPDAGNECTRTPSTLDGLLLGDGAPNAAYWTYAAYVSLTGPRIPVQSPLASVSVLGVALPGGGIRLLIGRHVTCTRPVNPDCPFALPLPTPLNLPLATVVPWSGPTALEFARIPNIRGPLSGPLTVRATAVAGPDGVIRVELPALWDGDALVVTAQPAG